MLPERRRGSDRGGKLRVLRAESDGVRSNLQVARQIAQLGPPNSPGLSVLVDRRLVSSDVRWRCPIDVSGDTPADDGSCSQGQHVEQRSFLLDRGASHEDYCRPLCCPLAAVFFLVTNASSQDKVGVDPANQVQTADLIGGWGLVAKPRTDWATPNTVIIPDGWPGSARHPVAIVERVKLDGPDMFLDSSN